MKWIILGILLVLLIRNHFDLQGVKKDIRMIAFTVRKIAGDIFRAIRDAVRSAKKENAGKPAAAPEKETAENKIREIPAAQTEVQENAELPEYPEQIARTAAMLVNVPTLDFPKDDPKYDSSKKYRYA